MDVSRLAASDFVSSPDASGRIRTKFVVSGSERLSGSFDLSVKAQQDKFQFFGRRNREPTTGICGKVRNREYNLKSHGE